MADWGGGGGGGGSAEPPFGSQLYIFTDTTCTLNYQEYSLKYAFNRSSTLQIGMA